MKKVLLLASVAVLALSSCKKDRTCVCEVFGTEVETTAKLTKKKAVEWCEDGSNDLCKLK